MSFLHSLPFFVEVPRLPMGALLVASVIITLLCAAAAHLLVDLLFKRSEKYQPPTSTLARLVGDLLASVKRFVLFSAPTAISMMAMWCVFFAAPSSAHAEEGHATKLAVHHRRAPPQPDEANKKFEAVQKASHKAPKPGHKADR